MHSLETIPPPIYYLCFLYNSTLGLLSSWKQKEEYLSVWDSSAVEKFFFFLNKLPMYQMTLLVWTTILSWSCIWCFTLLLPGLGDAEMLRCWELWDRDSWSTDSWGGAVQWTLSGRKGVRETEARQNVALAEAQPQSDPTGTLEHDDTMRKGGRPLL